MAFDRLKSFEISEDGLALDGGAHLTSGSAAPTHSGTKGDFYFRTSDATVYTLPADGTGWVRLNATSTASVIGSTTTTSTSDVLIAGMTLTPAAGQYLCSFQTSVSHGSNSGSIFASIYSGGTKITNSEINYTRPSAHICPISISNILTTVNGSQAIEARWRVAAGTGTSNLARLLTIVRVG